MRLKINAIALFIATVCVMTSCLNSDYDEVTTYDDTAITSITLGTLKCYIHTTSSKGTDSIYTVNVTGSKYPIYIDQIKHEAYNVDSLPLGTDMEHVLITVNTKNSGTPVIKSQSSDSVKYISSTDSLDFSTTRSIYAISHSGKYSREYKVNLVAHKEKEDYFGWRQYAKIPEIASFEKIKSIAFNGYIYVLGTNGSIGTLLKTANNDGMSWDTVTLPAKLSSNASIIKDSKTLYIYDSEMTYASVDGENWDSTPASGLKTFIGSCGNELYALSNDNQMMVSNDKGKTWNNDNLDDSNLKLPARDINYVTPALVTNKDVNRIIIIGNRDENSYPSDNMPVIWSKIVENDAAKSQSWSFYSIDSNNKYTLPCMKDLSVIEYDSKLLAIGGTGIAGSSNTAYSKVYQSKDCGLTWQENTQYALPASLSCTTAALSVDENNFIWLIATGSGEIWRGRLSQLGWSRK